MSHAASVTILACLSLSVIATATLRAIRELKGDDPFMRSWAKAVLIVSASGVGGIAMALAVTWA